MTYDDNHQPVPSVPFGWEEIYPSSSSSSEMDASAASLMQLAFSAALGWEGRADGFKSRMCALALIIQAPGFDTPKAIETRLGVSRRSLDKALARLKADLSFINKAQTESGENTNKTI